MGNTKIAFFETTGSKKKYINSKLSKQFDISFYKESLSFSNINEASKAEIIGIFINSKITAELIDKMPNLKFIATMSTGFDHIDLKTANEKGIMISNVPFYGDNTVAEHAFALILAISRKIIQANAKVKMGIFDPKGLMGFDLKNKTIGVMGCGSIGKNLIKIANGFSMNILAFDLKKDAKLEELYGVKYVSINDLLANSDIISLHLPYNEHTHHLINKENIKKIKKGAVIINTARGGLIDTHALYDALVDGSVKAAGLDVLEEEDYLKEEAELLYKDTPVESNLKIVVTDQVLINHPNVIITPHSAFNSVEAVKRILDTTIKNIVSFKLNKPENLVTM
ncbi:hydroxyacid dehydrogenase [candidate division WWE3 bacterium CG10_big_fil_rev_8_21_14_0_10_32_10]|uniref:Hydroxyacid dehydrogenase n=1 Tax=candidate division WWE3 bacterium CG10_big_fil_rev_8_21_14_0_10_32_10 TaxID=1975090 RepID=A0A2H0RBL9_UNCKA|nr:MAG: hydroxyacid dehydrogenase [candidate division WWE3 bacterium CG10_big_fil_rev_8_21_14_0_10_32_10]